VIADNGLWTATYEIVPVDEGDRVAAEVEAQLEAFLQLVGKNPTHLDSLTNTFI
jgi:predicted glycoside hydrolase/deacetylase ChbG (UPF0249 family)